MNTREAVLRELNLYPLWVLREGNSKAVGLTERPASLRADAASVSLGHTSALPQQLQRGAAAMARDELAIETVAERVAEGIAVDKATTGLSQLDWPELKTMVRDCHICGLRAGCTQTVFGIGDEKAAWLFVGEGPGADEDAQGEPFVGQAGKLLDNMLAAIRLKRGDNVFIANVVKCRPPGNRTPEAAEIAACFPYLQRQIALIQPKVIVALGKTAACALLGKDATLGSLRGMPHRYHGVPLIVTYHPAYLLRTPQDKAKAWQDLCLAVSTIKGTVEST